MLDWSRKQLAEAAGLAERTVIDFERGARTPHPNNLRAMRTALEEAGIEFLDENGAGVGIKFTNG
jgi:transcriptional regulator with XRE-family HTH domain